MERETNGTGDFYWGWILTVIGIIALVAGLLYGWQTLMCPIKGAKPSIGLLRLQTPLYVVFDIAQAAFIGMWVYILYLYLTPIIYGFTSNNALNATPPTYCDRVIGGFGGIQVPTTNQAYCAEIENRWRTDVGVVAASIVPHLFSVMFATCLLVRFNIRTKANLTRLDSKFGLQGNLSEHKRRTTQRWLQNKQHRPSNYKNSRYQTHNYNNKSVHWLLNQLQ
jgi:hypothetical protein